MKEFKNILLATDFSESSDLAFNYALSLAKKFEARLLIVHVINEPVDLRGFYVPHISFEKLEEEIEEGAQKMMEKFCRTHMRDYENYDSFIVPVGIHGGAENEAGVGLDTLADDGRRLSDLM